MTAGPAEVFPANPARAVETLPEDVAVSKPVPRLSLFFPAHNEEANLEPLVAEALASLPALARSFEIVIVDDGSRDETPEIADRLASANPGVVGRLFGPGSELPDTS